MSSIVKRAGVPILRVIAIVLLSVAVIAGWSVDPLNARPIKLILPKPFILNRGDGDTINGKYLMYESFGGGDSLRPSSTFSPSQYEEQRVHESDEGQYQSVRWIILYQLIR